MPRRAGTFGKPRKRTALRKSRLKANNRFNEDHESPSEAKWATMASYGSFVVDDSDGEEHTFTKEDCAIIVPAGHDPKRDWELWEYWVGKIIDIRAIIHDENSNSVWARVQWFYSGKDVSNVIKSFNRKIVGKHERVFSDHFDFVAPECFNGVVDVADFQEDDPEQTYIPRKSFYRRFTVEPKARKLLPKPGSKTCICSTPYLPEDMNPSKLMHFCPRPSCRTAYHEKCLLSIKSQDLNPVAGSSSSKKSPAKSARKHASEIRVKRRPTAVNGNDTSSPSQSRALRLLACSPDTDDEIDLQSLIPITIAQGSDTEIEPPKKKRRGRPKNIPSSTIETVLQQPRSLTEVLSTLPSDLLRVAQQPLVRGGAFAIGGVAGNIGAVTRARRMVYQVLEGGEVPDDWEEMLFGEDGDANVANAIVKLIGGKTVIPPLLCPKCNSAI